MFTALLDRLATALPSQCAVCEAWPARPLCSTCVARFGMPAPRCTTCAIEVPAGVRQCGECLVHPPPLDACFAAVGYRHPWIERVADFKYRANPGWAVPLAMLLRGVAGAMEAVRRADVVVPMPLSTDRLRDRGYNQALELARRLAAQKVDARLLLRIRETRAQNTLERRARIRNVAGAFAVEPLRRPDLRGRHVVLVDDVMTSGASLFAAAHALRAAEAATVTGVVLARTPEPEH